MRPQTAVFSKEEELAFSSQFLAIFIESNRKLYTNGMRGNEDHPAAQWWLRR